MFVRIFTLRFESGADGFENDVVELFLADKEVISIRDYFFERNGVPYIVLVVYYRLAVKVTRSKAPADSKKREHRDETWKQLLSEAEWPLFNTLRNWRSERSKQEGIPPYVICNNRQLAEIVKARYQSLEGLRQIEGFGDAKLKKYGPEMLALMAKSPPVCKEKDDQNEKA